MLEMIIFRLIRILNFNQHVMNEVKILHIIVKVGF